MMTELNYQQLTFFINNCQICLCIIGHNFGLSDSKMSLVLTTFTNTPRQSGFNLIDTSIKQARMIIRKI